MKRFATQTFGRVARVLRDGALRRVFANASRLIVGNAAQAVLGMFSLFMAARGLQVERFGQLVLVSSWSLIVLQLFSFQTSHALVKEGSVSAARDDFASLWGVVRVGLLLDVSSAAVAALIYVIGLAITSRFIEIETSLLVVAYAFVLPMITTLVGAPTAVLRLFDRYDAFILHGIVSGLGKLIFTAVAFFMQAGILGFGLAWVAAQLLTNVVLCWLAMREYRRQRGLHPLRAPIPKAREVLRLFPEMRSRLIATNLSATLRMVRDLDVPLLGLLLNPAAVGLFKVARQIGTAAMRVIDPIFQAVYPDMAAIEERAGPRAVAQLLRRSSIIVGSCGFAALGVFVLIGKPAIELGLGADFVAAFPAAVSCVLSAAIWGFSQSYGAALLVWNRHRELLVLNLVSSALYIGCVFVLAREWGVTGAGLASAIYFLAWSGVAVVLVRRDMRKRKVIGQ
jgi:O-antigen/teichoic acid export membrane protein